MNPRLTRGRRGAALGAALVLTAAMVLSACGGSGDDADTAENEGFLRERGSAPPASLDPILQTRACERAKLNPIYDTLIRIEPDGSLSPGLAESWELTDPTTFVLQLRSDVSFQDGTPFDAAAVKAHLDRAKSDPLSTLATTLSFVDSVDADGSTVTIHMSSPRGGLMAPMLASYAGMIPSPKAVEEDGDQYGVETAVGAGPFVPVELTPTEYFKLERWDGYYDPTRQKVDGIEFLGAGEEFLLQRLEEGDFNYASDGWTQFGREEIESAVDRGTVKIKSNPSAQFMHFFMDWSRAPFDDVRVRQAINYALDREALVAALTDGTATLASSPLPTSSWAHGTDVEGMYPYDPDRARELLAEAGYADGLVIEGASIDRDYYLQAAQAVQDMLSEVGITLNLTPVTGAAINDALYVRKQFAAAVTANPSNEDPGLALESLFSSTGANNPGQQAVDGVDELLAEGAATPDLDERAKVYQEVEKIVMEEAVSVPLYHDTALTVFAPNVENVERGYASCDLGDFVNPPIALGPEG